MITTERTLAIAASADELWAVLAEFDELARWASNVDHSSWLDPERPDGAMIGRARRVQVGRTVLVERITVWEPPECMAYELNGLPPIVKSAVNEWRLVRDPSDGARTQVTLASHVDCGTRPPQQLIARLVGRRLGGASDTMLAGLAGHFGSNNSKGTTT